MSTNKMEEEDQGGYTWESEYERPWEAIQEDIEGRMIAPDDDHLYKAKRRKLFQHDNQVKLGMMRHVLIVLDSTNSMNDKDLKPDRLTCSKTIIERFLDEFFDRNPISQVGLVVMEDGKARRLTELSGNPRVHKAALKDVVKCSGECSLQNAMDLSHRILRHIPSHASREVIIIHGSLTSCDPGNIFNSIKEFSQQSIRCSVIGLSAHVRLCHTMSQETGGQYDVAIDEIHFRDVILQHCRPPRAKSTGDTTLIKMGFPQHVTGGHLSVCMCHLDTKASDYLSTRGYNCPQCMSKYCELPIECMTCGMTLVLAPHLARSYHHLFPLEMFQEQRINDESLEDIYCTGCNVKLIKEVYICPRCNHGYCIDCDLYCHETLHNCPGCESGQKSSLWTQHT